MIFTFEVIKVNVSLQPSVVAVVDNEEIKKASRKTQGEEYDEQKISLLARWHEKQIMKVNFWV